MSLLSQTLILYAVVGLAVATAVYLVWPRQTPAQCCFLVISAVPFWPLYVPMLLSRGASSPASDRRAPRRADDGMAAAIAQVDAELEAALGSLDGWAEDVLAREKGRIGDLHAAFCAQAERIREMDRLLALPEETPADPDLVGSERLRSSLQARQENLDRLRRVRRQAHDDLLGMLAWVRELVSMIHLAKFTGAPASRADELLGQIAAAVEGLSELTWQDPATREPTDLQESVARP